MVIVLWLHFLLSYYGFMSYDLMVLVQFYSFMVMSFHTEKDKNKD